MSSPVEKIMMRSLFALVVLALLALSCQKPDSTVDASVQKMRDGVVIHLTHGSDNPHRVAMALRMATMMANDKDVLVYCDIKGIEAVLKDVADITYPTFPSARESLARLIANNVQITACPGCMKAAGKAQDDLMPGVVLAEKELFFNFTRGRVLTLDY
jgi:predicted peroxiredoxin